MKKKVLCRAAALLLALLLPLCVHADDSRRWFENITKMKRLPVMDADVLAGGFVPTVADTSAGAAAAALAWAETGRLHGIAAGADNLSLFVMADGGQWIVTLCVGMDTHVLTVDMQGRLTGLKEADPEQPAYEGPLPAGTDEAVLACIEAFARMNGCAAVTGYERIGCTGTGEDYDVRITAGAKLDGTECWFTLSLETMAFTALACPLQPVFVMPMTTPVPDVPLTESWFCEVAGEKLIVPALDHHRLGNAFSPVPANTRDRSEVFAIGLAALTEATGHPAGAFAVEPVRYGFSAESALHYWQLDFTLTTAEGCEEGYTVHVRDLDGAVLGVWTPEEANG